PTRGYPAAIYLLSPFPEARWPAWITQLMWSFGCRFAYRCCPPQADAKAPDQEDLPKLSGIAPGRRLRAIDGPAARARAPSRGHGCGCCGVGLGRSSPLKDVLRRLPLVPVLPGRGGRADRGEFSATARRVPAARSENVVCAGQRTVMRKRSAPEPETHRDTHTLRPEPGNTPRYANAPP